MFARTLTFDLVICDEAHKTVGAKESRYTLIHNNDAVPASKRLYMTATPRVISEVGKKKFISQDIVDMSNPEIYGPEFHHMSFREAIDLGILVDYQIYAVGITDDELHSYINKQCLGTNGMNFGEISHNYALEKFAKKYRAKCIVTYHSSVKKAYYFTKQHHNLFKSTESFHVNGKQRTYMREEILKKFKNSSKSVVSNSRCLTEGIDIPSMDAVYFCDPKSSTVDIVQAVGRVLRRADHRNKKKGYVVVPLFYKKGDNIEQVIETSKFAPLVNVIRSLSRYDERLQAEIIGIQKSNIESIIPNQNQEDNAHQILIVEGVNSNHKDKFIIEAISRLRLPFRNFEEAREFVRALGLKTQKEWIAYCKSGMKPDDMPNCPESAYKNRGWLSWGDWLKAGYIHPRNRKYQSYDQAKKLIEPLNLKNQNEWRAYSKSVNKPSDIPAEPPTVYKDSGWVNWGDWLGTGYISRQNRKYKSYDQAKKFVRDLGLKTQKEWRVYSKSVNKPSDIPADPPTVYKDNGWMSFADWLGKTQGN